MRTVLRILRNEQENKIAARGAICSGGTAHLPAPKRAAATITPNKDGPVEATPYRVSGRSGPSGFQLSRSQISSSDLIVVAESPGETEQRGAPRERWEQRLRTPGETPAGVTEGVHPQEAYRTARVATAGAGAFFGNSNWPGWQQAASSLE